MNEGVELDSSEIPWHSLKPEGVLLKLGSRLEGLSHQEAARRLERDGPNRLESPSKPSPLRVFLSQFQNYMILVLIFAALVSFLSGETTNAYVIMGIVLFISLLGFVQEFRAEQAMEALREMVAPVADVYRDGLLTSIPADQLVVGDIIFLEAGDKVPADARILDETALQAVEASLTGESQPVNKVAVPVNPESALADRANMAFMGTIISYGNCLAIVTATGKRTELGKISGLIQIEEEEPPLKIKLQQLARQLAILVLFAATAVFVVEIARGAPILETLIVAAALAVAGVPESLPFVVTLTLAYGTQIMAKRNAIIRSLPAVETLGSTTVICTDKTGTLTRGEMTVREIWTFRRVEVTGSGYDPEGQFIVDGRPIDPREDDIALLLRIVVLSNNAEVESANGGWRVLGDPTEGALIVAAKKAGLLEEVKESYSNVLEHPFDSDKKRMTTIDRFQGFQSGAGLVASMKGAPEVVVERCAYILGRDGVRPLTEEDRRSIHSASERMAERALRVLGVAWRPLEDASLDRDEVENELIFVGLVGIMDPPRSEAREAIKICKAAGIKPVMITGDHRVTARAVGAELGIGKDRVVEGAEIEGMSDEEIEQTSIFARVTAEHKVRIVQALKARGHIVAMTGDGVNDAPALKAADIGVAMGKTGTEVAKEASDMVITDDNFATIVAAVEEGRRIYDNLRKGTSYLLSCNVAELATIFVGVMLGLPVPLLALQILWINVVAEEFPAIGVSVEPAEANLMQRQPRKPKEPILSKGLLAYTLGISATIFLGSLGVYLLALRGGEEISYARTMTFATLGFFTLYNAYSSRSLHLSVLKIDPRSNKKLLAGIGASTVAILAAIYVPFLQEAFETAALRTESWLIVLGVSFSVVIVAEILKRTVPGLRQG
jgi:Ca2+-transporting ATPase